MHMNIKYISKCVVAEKVSKKKKVSVAKQQNAKVMGLSAGSELKEPKSQLGQPYYWARPLKLHILKSGYR